MKLQIVSGLSGSGKTIALHVLEDLGYYCIDNLPLELLGSFVKTIQQQQYIEAIAVGIDARTLGCNFNIFAQQLQEFKTHGCECNVLFLEADTRVLLKRFSETRRRHPLSKEGATLEEAIDSERELLSPIANEADLTLDTSNTNIHQLREKIRQYVHMSDTSIMTLQIVSFGFKNGLPDEMDLLFDMRCLPNPHWEPTLRSLTGKDKAVADFLEQQALTHKMFNDIKSFLETWMPYFEQENRNYLTVAIGCTGGQHRSVYMAERLNNYFRKKRGSVLVRHKELAAIE